MSVQAFAAEIVMPITPNDTQPITDVDGARRRGAVVCKGVAGNLVFVDAAGITRTFPLAVDVPTPFIVTNVKTASTATVLWLLAN